jgi:hypothetical protein
MHVPIDQKGVEYVREGSRGFRRDVTSAGRSPAQTNGKQACDPQAHVSQAHDQKAHDDKSVNAYALKRGRLLEAERVVGASQSPRKPLSDPAISFPLLAVRRAGEDDALPSSPSGFFGSGGGTGKPAALPNSAVAILLSSP